MIFRQLFDSVSCTYTYIIASHMDGEAVIIDPVLDKVDRYIQLLDELNVRLVKAIDTHLHADHVSGLGALRDRTRCITMMGQQTDVDVVSVRLVEDDVIDVGGLKIRVMYTPGHTLDSYSFVMDDRVFTGDTLFIRGTGRTDFQMGDSLAQYDSLFNKLLKLSDETLVYPGHDYKGDTVSTIGEEKRFNPRLQVQSPEEYKHIMDNLNLSNPKMMDVAVPANMRIGMSQGEVDSKGWSLSASEAAALLEDSSILVADLRDQEERDQHGVIDGSVHTLYTELSEYLKPQGMLYKLIRSSRKDLMFYCAYGERSAMAVELAQAAGLKNTKHLKGGIEAWKRGGLPLENAD